MSEIKYRTIYKTRCLFQFRAELDDMIVHLYSLAESGFAHILTFPLVAKDARSAAMGEIKKMGKEG